MQEAFEEKSLAPLWNVFTEPILCDYWTPKAGMVFRGLQKEATGSGTGPPSSAGRCVWSGDVRGAVTSRSSHRRPARRRRGVWHSAAGSST